MIISCLTSSIARFLESSASSFALWMIRAASSLASSTIFASFFKAFWRASLKICSASLSIFFSFASYSAFNAAASSLSSFAVSKSVLIFILRSSNILRTGLNNRYDRAKNRKKIAIARSTVSCRSWKSRLKSLVISSKVWPPFRLF